MGSKSCQGSKFIRQSQRAVASFFYGIASAMYFYDHEPPHFRAQYAEHHAVIAIDSGEVLVGDLPSRALKLVAEWTALHRGELEADWAVGPA